ncbi:MAG: glycosyltransferase family 2 protein [Duncaniella sp.]|nr:glycosyltransferase family 2 protein [Duncaniella sp.]
MQDHSNIQTLTPRTFEGRKPKVSVLIPMYNEEASLDNLFHRVNSVIDTLPQYDWEILLVNDGSRDHSLLIAIRLHLSDPRWHYLDLSRNWGKETAMMAGIDYVTGDCMIIMDADLQHPPEAFPLMLDEWMKGYDDIYGHRLTRGKEPWLRRKLSMLYYNILERSTRQPVLKNVGDFRCLDSICIEALRRLPESQRYTKGLFSWIGFRKTSVPFEQEERTEGETKWNFLSLLNLAIEGLTSYTTAPLRIASVAGLTVSVLAFIYMIYVLVKTIIWGDSVQGFPTLLIVLLLLGGLILLALGIIGEYIGRIFIETKRRPGYFVRDYDGTIQNPRNK